MKSKMIYAAAAVALLALGACTPKPADSTAKTDNKTDDVYTGVLPSADTYGVRYTLLLDYDDDNNGGDYDLIQTYFNSDSTGIQDVASFATEGDFTVATNNAGQQYLKLSGDGAGEMYFLAETDSTITMTDATITPVNTPGMNYTLKKVQ